MTPLIKNRADRERYQAIIEGITASIDILSRTTTGNLAHNASAVIGCLRSVKTLIERHCGPAPKPKPRNKKRSRR